MSEGFRCTLLLHYYMTIDLKCLTKLYNNNFILPSIKEASKKKNEIKFTQF